MLASSAGSTHANLALTITLKIRQTLHTLSLDTERSGLRALTISKTGDTYGLIITVPCITRLLICTPETFSIFSIAVRVFTFGRLNSTTHWGIEISTNISVLLTAKDLLENVVVDTSLNESEKRFLQTSNDLPFGVPSLKYN